MKDYYGATGRRMKRRIQRHVRRSGLGSNTASLCKMTPVLPPPTNNTVLLFGTTPSRRSCQHLQSSATVRRTLSHSFLGSIGCHTAEPWSIYSLATMSMCTQEAIACLNEVNRIHASIGHVYVIPVLVPMRQQAHLCNQRPTELANLLSADIGIFIAG
ncbi:hypothetical protein BKA93DRAFT_404474 [Sparassis latifolia]